MNTLTLSKRIFLQGIAVIFCFFIVFVWLQFKMKANMYAEKHLKTRHLVETAWSVVDHFVRQAEQGVIAETTARYSAIQVVKQMRYEKNEYFWINDLHHRMIMHPITPELDGLDLTDKKDSNGKALFKEFVRICKTEGGGMVDYHWPKPGEKKPAAKISYVKLIPEWGWIIGSGIYVDDVDKEISRLVFIISCVLGAIILAVAGITFLITRSIARPVERIVTGVNRVAGQVRASASEVTNGSQSLAESASELAASVEESSATLEQMSAMSRKATEMTSGAEELMNENIANSAKSLKAIVGLTRKMTHIQSNGDRIRQIIKSIDEIAFQTNLLALNAAVEAARAGEYGTGFAVVAEEVRNLAIRSTEAASDTQELLDTTIREINESAEYLNSVNKDFEKIIETATVMGEKTSAITKATHEINIGINQINTAVNEIDEVTQRTAATAQEYAAVAEEFNAQAEEMNGYVKSLDAVIHGKA